MTRLKLTYLLLIISNFYFGQNWQWAKQALGSYSATASEGWVVCTDISGNIFLSGTFAGSKIWFGNDTIKNSDSTSSDIFLVKYDPSGNVLWAKGAGGTFNDQGNSLSTDASGNIYMTGYFQSPFIKFGNDTLFNSDNSGLTGDIFIVKYTSSGNIAWVKKAGGANDDFGSGISTDNLGNVYTTGYFSAPTITFGTYTITNSGVANIFLVKHNSFGTALWARSIGGSDLDEGFSVATDTSGNVFVTGEFTSPTIAFGAFVLNNVGTSSNPDIFLAKYNSTGNVLWAKRAGGTLSDAPDIVVTDKSGNAYLTGGFNSPIINFGTFTLTSSGNYDSFLAKYDGAGNVLWTNSAGGTDDDYGYSLAIDNSGNVYQTGLFYSTSIIFGALTLLSPGLNDPMFLVKYNSFGNALCASSLESGGDDQNSVATDSFGNVFIGGDFATNPFVIGTNTLLLIWGENAFVAKCTFSCQAEGVNELVVNGNEIKIFPNPNSGSFKINFDKEIINGELILINSLGQKVFEQKIVQGSNDVNTKGLAAGLYNCILFNDKQQIGCSKISIE